MTQPHKRRGVGVALAAVLLLASACTGGKSSAAATTVPVLKFDFTGTAATINGVAVPASEIGDQVALYANPDIAQAALGDSVITDPATGQPTPKVVAQILQTELSVQALQSEADRRGVKVSDEVKAQADEQVRRNFGSAADSVPPAIMKRTVERYAMFLALNKDLSPPLPTDAELRATYDKSPSSYIRACVRHVLLKSAADATAVKAELVAGADFVKVAAAKSADDAGADGGDLGCVLKGSFVPAFEAAAFEGAVGEFQGPIQTEFGFHVLQVTTRQQATFDEAKEQILARETPPAFSGVGIFLQINLPKAKVVVDPRFGTWDPTGGTVIPVGAKSTDGLKVEPAGGSGATPTTAGTGK